MSNEIRRAKTNDPEMDAMVVVTQAFALLEKGEIKRVLKWAEDRYLTDPTMRALEMDFERLKGEIENTKKEAERLGVSDMELVHALAHVRQKKRLAPIGQDDDPESTEQDAVASINARVKARA